MKRLGVIVLAGVLVFGTSAEAEQGDPEMELLARAVFVAAPLGTARIAVECKLRTAGWRRAVQISGRTELVLLLASHYDNTRVLTAASAIGAAVEGLAGAEFLKYGVNACEAAERDIARADRLSTGLK